MIPVLQKGHSVLRKVAKPVSKRDIGSPKLSVIINKMKRVIAEQEDAVAVAAPQIGESLRLFVVSGKVFLPKYPEMSVDELAEMEKAGEVPPDVAFINPEITKKSRQKQKLLEGCLSVRWLYGNVERSLKVTVSALNERGEPFTRGASGLLAQIFQHEIDHLNGVLFVDSATELRDEPPASETSAKNS